MDTVEVNTVEMIYGKGPNMKEGLVSVLVDRTQFRALIPGDTLTVTFENGEKLVVNFNGKEGNDG